MPSRRALVGSLVALCALGAPGLSSAASLSGLTGAAGTDGLHGLHGLFGGAPAVPVARDASPVVLTGAQLPGWSSPPAAGVAQPYPSGVQQVGGERTAHNGTLAVPGGRTGADVDRIAAYAWSAQGWREVPVQVDERFPHFLANGRSDFSFYSGTDQELTYAWAPTAHTEGEEAWKKVFGECVARYAKDTAEVQQAVDAGVVSLGPQETLEDYTRAMTDPVAGLDDDDEVALQARDAGPMAPVGTPAPAGATDGQTVTVVDPLDPAGTRYLYLFQQDGGSTFGAGDGDVHMTRAADADRWLDRGSFADADPQKLGSSNTGYGPNLPGPVCEQDAEGDLVKDRDSQDRFPRDAMEVRTPTYRVAATGRWMVREVAVRKAGATSVPGLGDGTYGDDLVDRWKGRAFQQSPDSSISVVGFEDEQVNWEANAALLGWRAGPVRAIREVWGADSGTNVTKTETYYRDADVYRYRVRVHPIPSDGLYTSWDYNRATAGTYYNLLHPEGVPIDGENDDTGSIDQLPVTGQPAYFDAADPTFDLPSAVDRPEQVAGKDGNGSLVYVFEFKGATSATNATAVPYYRDDACLDDGTGDDPVQRPWPGEASTDDRVRRGYAALAGLPADAATTCEQHQGAYASHGIHFFATHDSDNATVGVPLTEVDGQQWRYSVPMDQPRNVLPEYAPNVVAPLQPVVTPYA